MNLLHKHTTPSLELKGSSYYKYFTPKIMFLGDLNREKKNNQSRIT